ncbi:hypothetical protein ACODT5_03730, partial [Streptomyces sp. 5.8]
MKVLVGPYPDMAEGDLISLWWGPRTVAVADYASEGRLPEYRVGEHEVGKAVELHVSWHEVGAEGQGQGHVVTYVVGRSGGSGVFVELQEGEDPSFEVQALYSGWAPFTRVDVVARGGGEESPAPEVGVASEGVIDLAVVGDDDVEVVVSFPFWQGLDGGAEAVLTWEFVTPGRFPLPLQWDKGDVVFDRPGESSVTVTGKAVEGRVVFQVPNESVVKAAGGFGTFRYEVPGWEYASVLPGGFDRTTVTVV